MDNSKTITKAQKLEQRYQKVSRSKVGIEELVQETTLMDQELDDVILSVKDNEFIKNKKERLAKLDDSKDSIKTILKKLKYDIKEMVREKSASAVNTGTSTSTAFSSFHKSYSAKDVLKKVNPELLQEIETPKDKKLESEKKASIKKTQSKKESNDYKIKQADAEQDKSRVKISVDPADSNYEPIKLSVSEDTSSIHKISDNNEKVYSALLDMGEVQMANHVHMMMERVKVGPKHKYVSEITENTKELKSVNDTNSNIEKYLDEIRLSLRTGQDTAIEREESIENVLVDEILAQEVQDNFVSEDDLPGFLETILSMMFGNRLIKFLMKGANRGLMFLAKSILRPALGWLLSALSGGITSLFNKLLSGPIAIFNKLKDTVYNFIGNTFEKFKTGFNSLKSRVLNIPSQIAEKFNEIKNFAKNYVNNKIAGVTKRITDFATKIKNVLKKIPGMSKLVDMIGLGADPNLSDSKKTPSNKKGGFVGNAIDSVKRSVSNVADKYVKAGKYVKDSVVTGGRAVYAAGGKAVDWTKGKLADVRKGISEISKKVGSKFSGIPKKLTEHVNRTGGIPAKGGIMNKLNKFTKVLRPIPYLGQAIMVGFAAKAAYDGWNNAGELYGVPQDEVSTAAKAASAVGALVNDLLWPLPVSQGTVASIALSLTGASVTKDGPPLKGNYDSTAALGDISQFENPPDDDFQPGGFSDEELLTASFKNINKLIPDSTVSTSQPEGDSGGYDASVQPRNQPNKSTKSTQFGNFSAESHPVKVSDFKAEGLVGSVSAKYESGRQGVYTVSTGKGDPGGVSYGTYQLASKTGTMQAFLNSSDGKKYREMFSGTTPGSVAFNNIYTKIANKDPSGFNEAQHNFIKRTHYDPVESIASSMGVKVSDRAVQEALWSQSVQHGRSGNKKIIQGALDKADPNDVPSFLRALYNSRSNYINGLSLPSNIKSGINARYSNELSDVLSISGSGGSETIVLELDTPTKAIPVDSPMNRIDELDNSDNSDIPVVNTELTPEKSVYDNSDIPVVNTELTPEKAVYDNSDIPVVPDYLANPKPFAVPKVLDLTAKDLMKVESETPLMMQGVKGSRPGIEKPDNKEHDPRQDVEEDEELRSEFEQPTKGNGTNLKALQDRYISLYTPWNPDFDGLRTETKERFLGMAKEFYEKTGNKIQVNSAFRSMKKQQELYDNRHNNSNPVAAPGGSIHNYGMALDIQSDQVRALKSSGLLAKYGFGTPVKNDPPHIEDITVNRDKIRKTPYDPANQPGSSDAGYSGSPSFGDAYDGEATDYGDSQDQSASDLLESLGLDPSEVLNSFQGSYTSATTAGGDKMSESIKSTSKSNTIQNPTNNKTKSQEEMESVIMETQELVDQENSSIYTYIDKITSSLQESINNNTIINNTTSESTSDIFSINNTEYYPDQELRY